MSLTQLKAREMCMERITSKTNRLVKDTKKLMTSSRERKERSLFVLEGARLCFDVLNSVYEVKTVFITDAAYDKYKENADALIEKADEAYLISEDVAEKLGDTQTSQGVFAVCKMRESNNAPGEKVLALDNVQDPANIGAIIRTAEALGIDSLIVYNCCDLYNPKALRASMGGILRTDITECDNLEELLLSLKGTYRIYSTVPDASAKDITEIDFSKKTVCVIGNEANGVEENIKSVSDGLITIPMKGNAESLNAGVAAAITMWEMLR